MRSLVFEVEPFFLPKPESQPKFARNVRREKALVHSGRRARRPWWCHNSKYVHLMGASNGVGEVFPACWSLPMMSLAGLRNFSLRRSTTLSNSVSPHQSPLCADEPPLGPDPRIATAAPILSSPSGSATTFCQSSSLSSSMEKSGSGSAR